MLLPGIHEYGEWDKHLWTNGLNDKYINSGVLLINLKKIREEKLDDSMIFLANMNKYCFPDQDIINLVCRDRIVYLDNKFNCAETTGKCEKPIITHYIRGNKGWNIKESLWDFYKKEFLFDKEYLYEVKASIFYNNGQGFDDRENGLIRRKPNGDSWLISKERYDFLEINNAVELIGIKILEVEHDDTSM